MTTERSIPNINAKRSDACVCVRRNSRVIEFVKQTTQSLNVNADKYCTDVTLKLAGHTEWVSNIPSGKRLPVTDSNIERVATVEREGAAVEPRSRRRRAGASNRVRTVGIRGRASLCAWMKVM